MSNLFNRLIRLEQKLIPQDKIVLVVDETEGENVNDKILEKEKELGMKINMDKILLLIVSNFY